jgi:RNA polymerase sigma-B factor
MTKLDASANCPIDRVGVAALPAGMRANPRPRHSTSRDPWERARGQALEHQLSLRYHRHGDLRAREQLAERFLPLARDLASRYFYTGEAEDDLVQVASLGLLKAIDRYEPGRGTRFTSYAAPTILGELKRHFRDKGWALRVPRDLQERVLNVNRATERLSTVLSRAPKVREVAAETGYTAEEVVEAYEAARCYEAVSLDAPVSRDAGEPTSLVNLVGSVDSAYSLVDSRYGVAETWAALPEIEREVMRLRFVHDLTQREIGDRIGFSQMHVSRLLRRALTRLKQSAAQAA